MKSKHAIIFDDHVILKLYIQPNAKQDKAVGLYDDQIKIQITAPAQDNKANSHLQKWLAKEFDVPRSRVSIIKGEHARQKTVRIDRPRKMAAWLEI